MRVLNFGSLNIDLVYRVPHIVAPGETLAALSFERFAGGKGLNQSIALAHAGADVAHAGNIGQEGAFLRDMLDEAGVDVTHLRTTDHPNGHAIIQVDDRGENAIVIHEGANGQVTAEQVEQVLAAFEPGDVLLLQNEINEIDTLITQASAKGMRVAFNPAPMTDAVRELPIDRCDLLIVNQGEGAALSGSRDVEAIIDGVADRAPSATIVLTLGADGAICRTSSGMWRESATPVDVVDTTAAGDTFVGFFLATWLRRSDPATALTVASQAAGLSVSRPGAAASIPRLEELSRLR